MKPIHFRPINKCCVSCKESFMFHTDDLGQLLPAYCHYYKCVKHGFSIEDPLYMICDDYTEE